MGLQAARRPRIGAAPPHATRRAQRNPRSRRARLARPRPAARPSSPAAPLASEAGGGRGGGPRGGRADGPRRPCSVSPQLFVISSGGKRGDAGPICWRRPAVLGPPIPPLRTCPMRATRPPCRSTAAPYTHPLLPAACGQCQPRAAGAARAPGLEH
ncbi:MAG: hypothetical protein J3K34DRAFT_267482 [Monoraphidium minutum]|nr:MAG: hypothetical protein J3K34DRAFT_267482 [Monoraphidium minutum]